MPIVNINNPEMQELVDEMLNRISEINTKRGITLTNYANAFVKLLVETWINEPPGFAAELFATAEVVEEGGPYRVLNPDDIINNFKNDWITHGLTVYQSSLDIIEEQDNANEEHITFFALFHAVDKSCGGFK